MFLKTSEFFMSISELPDLTLPGAWGRPPVCQLIDESCGDLWGLYYVHNRTHLDAYRKSRGKETGGKRRAPHGKQNCHLSP